MINNINFSNIKICQKLKNNCKKTVPNLVVASTLTSLIGPIVANNIDNTAMQTIPKIDTVLEQPLVHPEDGTVYVIPCNPALMYYPNRKVDSTKWSTNLEPLNR